MATPVVLVAEPDRDVLEVLVATLEGGFEVLEARTCTAAFALARAAHPDFALIAQALPHAGGAELLRALRRSVQTRSIRVGVTTTDPWHQDDLWAAGADMVLLKPFLDVDLARVIARAADRPAWAA